MLNVYHVFIDSMDDAGLFHMIGRILMIEFVLVLGRWRADRRISPTL